LADAKTFVLRTPAETQRPYQGHPAGPSYRKVSFSFPPAGEDQDGGHLSDSPFILSLSHQGRETSYRKDLRKAGLHHAAHAAHAVHAARRHRRHASTLFLRLLSNRCFRSK